MIPGLETDRLLLRPLQLADATQTQLLFPKWEIVRFLNASVPWPYSSDGAFTFYRYVALPAIERDVALPAIERGDEWHWTLRLKQSPDQHIGSILLSDRAGENRGFWLSLPWHGQGLMTEAVTAANDFWFNVLGFSVLRAPKAIANAGSRRISEKTRMRRIATMERLCLWSIAGGAMGDHC